jgi:PKD repeat protein
MEKKFSTWSTDEDQDQLYYIWDWDDTTPYDTYGPYPSGEPCQPTHHWQQPGDYDIRVKARDQHYRESAWSNPLTITITQPLTANAHGPYHGFANETLQFTGSSQGGKPPYGWTWELEPSTFATQQNPQHIYNTPGDYPIILTVTDATGNQSSNTTICHIAPPNELSVTIQSSYQGRLGDLISFQGTVEQGTTPYHWHWDFDDGTIQTRQTPSHEFTSPGLYTITLTVTDAEGLTGTDQQTIQIINTADDTTPPTLTINKPSINSLYLNDQKVLFWPGILAIGDLSFEISGSDDLSGIDQVNFLINDDLHATDKNYPYIWTWTEKTRIKNTVTIQIIDHSGNIQQRSLTIWRFL